MSVNPEIAPAAGVTETSSNRVIVTVVGRDQVGIIAAVSHVLAQAHANIIDISQSVKSDFFVMFAVVDLAQALVPLEEIKRRLAATGAALGLRIETQHEDVFQFMHRI